MTNWFCINKSGSSIPVWDRPGFPSIEHSVQIGTIYNNEAFGYDWDWGGDGVFNHIVFRNGSGNVAGGFVIDNVVGNVNQPLPSGWATDCTDYKYGTVTIGGTTYKTFKFRRSETIYTPSATSWGSVAANMRVACLSSTSGSSNPHWKLINYVERSSDGAWIQVSGAGHTYGFVNTGLEDGSTPSTISMYGTW